MDVVHWFLLCLGLTLGFVGGMFFGVVVSSKPRKPVKITFPLNLHSRN